MLFRRGCLHGRIGVLSLLVGSSWPTLASPCILPGFLASRSCYGIKLVSLIAKHIPTRALLPAEYLDAARVRQKLLSSGEPLVRLAGMFADRAFDDGPDIAGALGVSNRSD